MFSLQNSSVSVHNVHFMVYAPWKQLWTQEKEPPKVPFVDPVKFCATLCSYRATIVQLSCSYCATITHLSCNSYAIVGYVSYSYRAIIMQRPCNYRAVVVHPCQRILCNFSKNCKFPCLSPKKSLCTPDMHEEVYVGI